MDVRSGANTKTGTLTLGDKSYTFPVYEGTIGPDVIDISKLYGQANVFTYDPGYTSTASCESKITYIDGDQDPYIPRRYAERFVARQVVHFPAYGHWLPAEAPAKVAEHLLAFLEADSSRS